MGRRGDDRRRAGALPVPLYHRCAAHAEDGTAGTGVGDLSGAVLPGIRAAQPPALPLVPHPTAAGVDVFYFDGIGKDFRDDIYSKETKRSTSKRCSQGECNPSRSARERKIRDLRPPYNEQSEMGGWGAGDRAAAGVVAGGVAHHAGSRSRPPRAGDGVHQAGAALPPGGGGVEAAVSPRIRCWRRGTWACWASRAARASWTRWV